VSAVNILQFVSYSLSYIILRSRWRDVVLNVGAPTNLKKVVNIEVI
jgi:hypothetical protein